ncbi:MAG: hypothetical protein RKO66_04210 [Candidatus Contendobacter sp.]|nr:hypothetical protein [Candidatus Contendobacter sp.]MDS4058472.1 hypothetical protein [Candidatus Contendobacter sp.]
MSLKNLYHTLLSVSTDKKTGRVYVYVRENGAKRTGTIEVHAGDILSVNYSKKTGATALEKFLSLMVEEIIFMPRSDVGGNAKEPNTPSIADVLIDLERLLSGNVIENNDFRQELIRQELRYELQKEVEALLRKIYGPGIANEIEKIAKSHSPHQNPNEFLNQCKAKAMLMLSKDQVEKMFESLYKKII